MFQTFSRMRCAAVPIHGANLRHTTKDKSLQQTLRIRSGCATSRTTDANGTSPRAIWWRDGRAVHTRVLVLASANERDGISTVMEEDVEEGEEEIPPEIWEAEEKAEPMRNARLIAYTLVGAAAGLVAVGRIETIKDLQAAGTTSIGDVLPIVLDVGIIPIAAYFAYEDMKNRYENVERIWKEVKAKKASTGRTKSSAGNRTGKGFGSSSAASVTSARASPKPVVEKKDSGPLAGLKSMFEEANEEAKIQAYQVNNMLEDKGVLKKLAPRDENDVAPENVEQDAMTAPPRSTSNKKTGKQRSRRKR